MSALFTSSSVKSLVSIGRESNTFLAGWSSITHSCPSKFWKCSLHSLMQSRCFTPIFPFLEASLSSRYFIKCFHANRVLWFIWAFLIAAIFSCTYRPCLIRCDSSSSFFAISSSCIFDGFEFFRYFSKVMCRTLRFLETLVVIQAFLFCLSWSGTWSFVDLLWALMMFWYIVAAVAS